MTEILQIVIIYTGIILLLYIGQFVGSMKLEIQ